MFQRFTGLEYLKIDIANSFGLSKKDWDFRIKWFDQNEHQLDSLIQDAKEPAMLYAGIKAYRDVLAGKPIGYMINLDATASGIQILSALTCDPNAARLCNVIDNGKRMDAYQALFALMKETVGEAPAVTADNVKQAIMTAFYGSRAVPESQFGKGSNLLDGFYHTLETHTPGPWEVNCLMPTLWNPEAYSHDWIMSDNFHVQCKVEDVISEEFRFDNQTFVAHTTVNRPVENGLSLGANMVHSIDGLIVREMIRRCDHDVDQLHRVLDAIHKPAKIALSDITGKKADMVRTLWERAQQSRFLSVRILDYLDEETVNLVDTMAILKLIGTLPEKPFKVISIHDCFRCLPHYGNDLRYQYNLLLAQIAKSEMLTDLLTQIAGQPIQAGKIVPNLHAEILEANYALS